MFERIRDWFSKEESSKDVAVARLAVILMHDRTKTTHETMTRLRSEIIQVVEKYFDIEEHNVELSYEQEKGSLALIADIPLINAKRQPVSPR